MNRSLRTLLFGGRRFLLITTLDLLDGFKGLLLRG